MKTVIKTAALKADATDEGIIEGYASVFNGVDSYGDTIDPKAYDDIVESKSMPIMLYNHDRWELPIGKWTEMSVDDYGLKVKGQLNLNNTRAKEIFDSIKFGSVSGMSVSIGLADEDFYEQKETGGSYIEHVSELSEISVVSFPADHSARISSCKSVEIEQVHDIKDLEKCLRDAGFSRNDAKGFISKAKSVLTDQRDAEKQVADEQAEILARIKAISNKSY